jgi:glycosyltransferase involved in cell wall biosynthesis
MKIAILGTRGIPNYHGGFEQFAEYLAKGLIEKNYDVTVYNSHSHPYKQSTWNGVKIVHCYDPENKIGTAGQFIYDFNCIRHARKMHYDIILQLGYTSSSVWGWLLPRKECIVTTNMDGLEWKRSKYSKKVQNFLRYAEKLGVKYSDYLIADSIGIQQYLHDKYRKNSVFIPYGATLFTASDDKILSEYNVSRYNFNMLIARLEPENSIEVILDGTLNQKTSVPFLVIGKHKTKYGEYLKNKYRQYTNIRFLDGIYDINKLNNLRHFSNLYFHGHTVGGTNPSLLEAMASQALICAHDNIFNKSILEADAYYFSNAADVTKMLDTISKGKEYEKIRNNEEKIEHKYSWPIIIEQYVQHFNEIKNMSPKAK